MKNLLVLLGISCLVISCNNSTEVKSAAMAKNSDMTQQNLKGRVQHFEETSFTVDSTGTSKMDSLLSANDFDAKGYQTDAQTKDSTGKVHMNETISHDSIGNVTEVKQVTDGKTTYHLVTEIKDGKYTGGKTFDSTGKADSYFTDIACNEYGIVYAGKQHFMDGRIKQTFDDKFDGATYVSGTSTDSTGKVSYTGSVKVNDKGDPIEETSTTREKDSTKTEKMTYKYDSYDDQGNWTQRTTTNEKGKTTKIVKRTYAYYKD